MKLIDYLRERGDAKASKLFGVKERTVASWRRGEREPRPEQAAEIERITDGLVKFSDCYQLGSVQDG